MLRKTRRRPRRNFARAVKAVLNKQVETKFYLNDLNGAPASDFSADNPLTVSLNPIAGGTGSGQRIGNQIKMSGLYGKLFLVCNSSSTSVQYLCRMIMYVPKDASNQITSLAFNQAPDLDQFTILEDKYIRLSKDGSIPTVNIQNIRKRLRMTTQFTNSFASSIAKNPVYIYLTSNVASTTDQPVTVQGFIKSYYKDY